MANPEHVEIVRQGAKVIAEWRRANRNVTLDLTGADLRHLNLDGADLRHSNLRYADLSWSDLSNTRLQGSQLVMATLFKTVLIESMIFRSNLSWTVFNEADLTNSDLSGSDMRFSSLLFSYLIRTDLSNCDLSGATLQYANMHETILNNALLRRADLTRAAMSWTTLNVTNFTEARLGFTLLAGCDVSSCKGLDTVHHAGPSSIATDTLILTLRSAGGVLGSTHLKFLRDAGVPIVLLEALPKMMAEMIYYSCFISYGQPDLAFARTLRDNLTAKGVTCWLYDLDATPGERTQHEIKRRLREAEKVIVLCSTAALVREGVLIELEELIDENPDKLIPISLDDIWMHPGFRVMRGSRDLGPFLRERNYADFKNRDYN